MGKGGKGDEGGVVSGDEGGDEGVSGDDGVDDMGVNVDGRAKVN